VCLPITVMHGDDNVQLHQWGRPTWDLKGTPVQEAGVLWHSASFVCLVVDSCGFCFVLYHPCVNLLVKSVFCAVSVFHASFWSCLSDVSYRLLSG